MPSILSAPPQCLELVEGDNVRGLDQVALAVEDEVVLNDGIERRHLYRRRGEHSARRPQRRSQNVVKTWARREKAREKTRGLRDTRECGARLGVLDDGGDLQLLDAEADRHELGRPPEEAINLNGAHVLLHSSQVYGIEARAEETEA